MKFGLFKKRKLPYKLSWFGVIFFLLGAQAPLAENVTNLLREAEDAYKNQDYKAAIDFYNQIIEIETNSWMATLGRGGAYLHLGEFDKAENDYNRGIFLATNNIPLSYAYLNRGYFYQQTTNFEKAVNDFSKAVQINPSYQFAYVQRAYSYNQQGLFDSAIIDCNMAILLNPDDAEAYRYKGDAFHGKQNWDKAIEAYSKAIELDTNDVWTYRTRANAYSHKEDYTNAIADFDKIIRLKPADAWVFACRGEGKSRIGDFKGGIIDCQKALLLDTNCFLAYNNLAWLLATAPQSKLRDGQKAVEYAKRACELTLWKNPYCLGTLAAAYAETSNFSEAVKWERKCILLGFPEREMKQARMELNLFEEKKPYHAGK
jgi:tetratricopeptide (TPR) repeat protein